MKKVLIQTSVAPEKKTQLKNVAKQQGITLNALMCIIINDYLKGRE